MSKMGRLSATDKVVAVEKYLDGKESHASIAKEYDVSRSTFQKWLSNYQAMGEDGLHQRAKNRRYPESLKRDAVSDYASDQFGNKAICEKYQIRSRTQLEQWILLYNGHSKQSEQDCSQEGNAMPRAKKTPTKTKQASPHQKLSDKRLEHAGIRQSMSRAGHCIDNGPMEGFWGILKAEMHYLFQFETYEALEAAIYEYIDFYNNRRYQKRLGCMTPNEFIQQSSLNK